MKDKGEFDINLSQTDVVSTRLGVLIVVLMAIVFRERSVLISNFLIATCAFGIVKLFLLIYKKDQFAKGIKFEEQSLTLFKGLFRAPITLKWKSISKAKILKNQLAIESNGQEISLNYIVSSNSFQKLKAQLVQEFSAKNIPFE